MLIDARQLNVNETLHADVCIIGAGTAGTMLAHGLLGSGLSVILADARGKLVADTIGDGIDAGAADAGAALDAIDFLERDWLPGSGWPIGRGDLESAYRRAMGHLGAGPFPAGSGKGDGQTLITEAIPDCARFPDCRKRFGDALAAADTLAVLLHAHCLRIGLGTSGRAVELVHLVSSTGRPFTISTQVCVLAAGPVETPRLLLLSDDVMSCGIGNQKDFVGRFATARLRGDAGVLTLAPAAVGEAIGRQWWIAPWAQRRHRLVNFVAVPAWPPAGKAVTATSHGRLKWGDFLAGCLPGRRRADRQALSIPPPQGVSVEYVAEQPSDAANRIRLTADVDAFGRRAVVVEWRITSQHQDAIIACCRVLGPALYAAGIGTLACDEVALCAECRPADGYLSGTTRMAGTPAQGVVDRDNRVFGIDNLYIASASTFPTCGRTAPVLSAAAMAIRLADHLRLRLRRPRVEPLVAILALAPFQQPIPSLGMPIVPKVAPPTHHSRSR